MANTNSEEADFPVLAHNDHLTGTTDNDDTIPLTCTTDNDDLDLMADGDNVNLPLKANIDKVTAKHYSISLNCDLEKVGYIVYYSMSPKECKIFRKDKKIFFKTIFEF